MATKNKKDLVGSISDNFPDNTAEEITPLMARNTLTDLVNSMPVCLLIADLQADDDSALQDYVQIMDDNKQGIFYYDATDTTTADDGSSIIVTSTNRRFKRLITSLVNAKWYGQSNTYFSSVTSANSLIKPQTRFVGMEVMVPLATILTVYWYRDGIADGNLVPKSSQAYSIDFDMGDGGANTPTDGNTVYANTVLVGARVLGFWYANSKMRVIPTGTSYTNANIWAEFNTATGQIILHNGTFNVDSPPVNVAILYTY